MGVEEKRVKLAARMQPRTRRPVGASCPFRWPGGESPYVGDARPSWIRSGRMLRRSVRLPPEPNAKWSRPVWARFVMLCASTTPASFPPGPFRCRYRAARLKQQPQRDRVGNPRRVARRAENVIVGHALGTRRGMGETVAMSQVFQTTDPVPTPSGWRERYDRMRGIGHLARSPQV